MNNISKPMLSFLFLFLFLFNPTLRLVLANIESCLDSVCHMKEPIIRFPFQIQGKQPKTCGYPGFKVSCSDQGQTLLKLPNSGQFSIKGINYATQQVWLNDPNNCLPKRILSLNLSGSPFDAVYYQQFTFFNCSFNLEYLTYRYNHISCLSDSHNKYKVIATSSSSVVVYLSSVCDLVDTVKVPVQLPFYDHVRSSDLTDDLRLSWDSPPCGRCESPGGRCGFNFNITNSSTFEVACSNFPTKGISQGARYVIAICIGVPALLCFIAILSCICSRFRFGTHGWAWSRETVADFDPLLAHSATIILGLDRPTIESYPKIVLDESLRLPKPDDETCPICLSEYRPKETVKRIPECRHCFHAQCIDEWLPLNASCPICRTSPQMLTHLLDPT